MRNVASGFSRIFHVSRTIVVAALVMVPSLAAAQALPNISSLSVRYNTRKATVKPQGELKAQIDAVDKEIAAANRLGRIGEVRRQIAKGMTLLDGQPWTPALDFQNSLALRSERTVIDSSVPYALRLEQIYSPSMELTPALSAKVVLRKRMPPPPPGSAPAMAPPGRELGVFDGLSRDLRESPFAIELNLAGAEDGPYVIETEVLDGTTSLATATLGVVLHKGLDARLRALEAAATSLVPAVRADVTYPADYIRNVNRGRYGLGTFSVGPEIATAEAVLAAAQGGKNPFKTKTGDFERHYVLEGPNEVMPYRVYVPKSYSATTGTPLVIALHGLGGNEDSMFDQYSKLPPQLAEKHGFLLAAPNGFRVDGFYGSTMMGAGDAASRRRVEYSEKDVLEVLRLMKANYKVDESRIYLLGHSMGAIGTWALGAKYPDTWAALVPFSGMGAATMAERMKGIPQFVVHGDNDATVNVNGSRSMVAALKQAGATVTYLEIPGGSHTDVVVPNLPKAFEFLAAQKKASPVATQQQ
ncbi:MAG: PHB depolymerase family esterase [Vicinamibacterales bacterium]|jgi:predicted esterase